ncbi:MAG TPA: NUDIX hydrolase [Candidatus Dormibacteraeota bacterium]|jgi:ADP-ribose pyrophosphatase|nr:NUDIX hydrolase [Candidatus Dormibacteraeota bacterium]
MANKSAASEKKTAQILSSEMLYQGPVFGLRRDELIEPTGLRTKREVITHPGSVVVLPVLPDGNIVMIQQYRHATKQYLWELVAGRMEPGEDPKTAAARELAEETGYHTKKLKIFLDVFPTPGFLEERMFLLLASDVQPGTASPEDDEKIVSAVYTPQKLEQMIHSGKLRDAKSIAGLLYYFRFLAPKRRTRKKR